jgi:hypothetical protein
VHTLDGGAKGQGNAVDGFANIGRAIPTFVANAKMWINSSPAMARLDHHDGRSDGTGQQVLGLEELSLHAT